jgi:hypothetical protein
MARTLKAIRGGFALWAKLPRHERDWVAAKLRGSASPENAKTASVLLKSLKPTKRPIFVFLSHNSKDKPFVRAIYQYLSNSGLKVWLDEAELNGGDSLVEALAEAVFRVDCVVAVISKISVGSNWVKKELAWAMNREIKGKRIRVIPIMKDLVSIPRSLSDKLYLDFSTPYKRGRNRPVLLSSILNQAEKSTRRRS